MCLGVRGAHLKQQSRDILPPTAGCVHGDKLFNVRVALGFDRDEFAFASARSLHATARLASAVTVADNQMCLQTCSIADTADSPDDTFCLMRVVLP
jgi:hypothetical protein